MLDFILIAAISVLLLYFELNIFLVAGAAFVIGLFWGGLDFIFKMIFVALASAILPVVFALWQAVPFNILTIGMNAFALTMGYVVGSLLSTVLFPLKLIGKLFKAIAGIFRR